MNAYGSLLIALIFCAVGAAGILWGLQQRHLPPSGETAALIRELQAENARLRRQLETSISSASPAETEGAPANPVLPALDDGSEALQLDLAYRSAELRGLSFASGPAFETVSFEKVYRNNQDELRADFPGDAFARTTAAFQTIALIKPDTSIEQVFLDHSDLFGSFALDADAEKILVAEGSSLNDPATQQFFVRDVLRLLQTQTFDRALLTLSPDGHWDRFLATRALTRGDVMIHIDAFIEASRPAGDADSGQTPRNEVFDQLEAAAGTAPGFLQRLLLFPNVEGAAFCRALIEQDALDAAFASPPVCTSHILHPELYRAEPRYLPRALDWSQALAGGTSPIFDSTLGEFLVREWLASALDDARAATLALPWDGDRCILFEDGDGVHLLWGLLWRSPEAAEAFLAALTEIVPALFDVAASGTGPETQAALRFEGTVPVEVLRPAPDRVFLVRSGSEEWIVKLRSAAVNASAIATR